MQRDTNKVLKFFSVMDDAIFLVYEDDTYDAFEINGKCLVEMAKPIGDGLLCNLGLITLETFKERSRVASKVRAKIQKERDIVKMWQLYRLYGGAMPQLIPKAVLEFAKDLKKPCTVFHKGVSITVGRDQ